MNPSSLRLRCAILTFRDYHATSWTGIYSSDSLYHLRSLAILLFRHHLLTSRLTPSRTAQPVRPSRPPQRRAYARRLRRSSRPHVAVHPSRLPPITTLPRLRSLTRLLVRRRSSSRSRATRLALSRLALRRQSTPTLPRLAATNRRRVAPHPRRPRHAPTRRRPPPSTASPPSRLSLSARRQRRKEGRGETAAAAIAAPPCRSRPPRPTSARCVWTAWSPTSSTARATRSLPT